MRVALQVVAGQALPDPPYSSDTKANGFKQEVDWRRITQSKTWIMADPECRHVLLTIWLSSWENVPCGTWEPDDAYIAASIGCKLEWFNGHREQLMRGWIRHSDGRLYHPYITAQVQEMLRRRKGTAERMRKMRDGVSRGTDCDSAGTTSNTALRVSDASQLVTYAKEQEQEHEQLNKSTLRVDVRIPADSDPPPTKNCPIAKIVALYHERLPELPKVEKVTQTRAGLIRQRWREDLPTIEHWENFFAYVSQSKFLMGRAAPNGNRPPFVADLEWLVRPSNFAKIAEERYHRG